MESETQCESNLGWTNNRNISLKIEKTALSVSPAAAVTNLQDMLKALASLPPSLSVTRYVFPHMKIQSNSIVI